MARSTRSGPRPVQLFGNAVHAAAHNAPQRWAVDKGGTFHANYGDERYKAVVAYQAQLRKNGSCHPDATYPVWTAPEEPGPVDTADTRVALPVPGWLLHSTAADGVVRLVNHGSDRLPPPPAPDEDSPHYTRFAYASAAAPDTAGPGIDNHIALVAADGEASRRGRIHPLGAAGRRAASWHTARLSGAGHRIETTSVVHGPWEVRVHQVAGPRGAVVREGGWRWPTTPGRWRRERGLGGRGRGARTG